MKKPSSQEMVEILRGKSPAESLQILQSYGYLLDVDETTTRQLCKDVIEANPGQTKIDFLIGQVKKRNKDVSPKFVREVLIELLAGV